MADNSVSSVICDPPYSLGFMGKAWDKALPSVEIWREALRVVRPGGHLLAFGGSKTFHRLAVSLEDAGWEMRDTVCWLYGSGFPKGVNLSKAIDRELGLTEEQGYIETTGGLAQGTGDTVGCFTGRQLSDEAVSKEAALFDGYNTALKPAWEPILVCMKPLEGTFAENALKWGVAGLNIDACRVPTFAKSFKDDREERHNDVYGKLNLSDYDGSKGRWPANVVLDGEAAGALDAQAEKISRFFYCVKASPSERNLGCEARNTHPTVKPLALMRYLIQLIAPPKDGLILDPFAGSGSTLVAAHQLGIRAIGIERESEYVEIARARIKACDGSA